MNEAAMSPDDSLTVVTDVSDRPEAHVLAGLARAGFKMRILCDPQDPHQALFNDAGIDVQRLHIRHRLDRSAIRTLRREFLLHPPALLYAPRNKSLSTALLASRGMPMRRVAYRGTMGHISRLDPASWLTYLNPRLDRILCVSHAVEDYLRTKGLPAERLTTIYKGHDPDWYAGASPRSALAEFGIPPEARVVVFVGNMRPVKGVDTLLRAARMLPAGSDIHVLMIGEVRDRAIQRLAADPAINARVHFTGFRKDAPALVGACDLFVMPSVEREGLPRALLEAMAQGIPAVVTAVGGMPEVIHEGQEGFLVPPRDPAALCAAILKMFADEEQRKRMARAARECLQERFNIHTTIKQTTALFRSLAEVPSASAQRSR